MLPLQSTIPIFEPNPEMVVVVTIINGYGDTLLALPVLRKLCRLCNSIYIICYRQHADTLLNDLDAHFIVISYPDETFEIPEDKIDAHISFNAYYPCAADKLLRIRFPDTQRWGFCNQHGQPLLTDLIQRWQMRDQYFAVLGWKPDYSIQDRRIYLPDKYKKKVENYFQLDKSVVFHLDSLEYKMWPVENWVAVANYVIKRYGLSCILLGQDHPDIRTWLDAVPSSRQAPPNILLQCAILQHAYGFIGIDSFFMHVADSLQKPLVALFCEWEHNVWHPVEKHAIIVEAEIENDIRSISLVEVIKSVEQMLRHVK